MPIYRRESVPPEFLKEVEEHHRTRQAKKKTSRHTPLPSEVAREKAKAKAPKATRSTRKEKVIAGAKKAGKALWRWYTGGDLPKKRTGGKKRKGKKQTAPVIVYVGGSLPKKAKKKRKRRSSGGGDYYGDEFGFPSLPAFLT